MGTAEVFDHGDPQRTKFDSARIVQVEQFDKPRNPENKVQECDEYPIGVP